MNRTLVTVALLLAACGPDDTPEVEVPSWAHVAPKQIAEAKKHGVTVAFENDLGMRFVLIPAGTFLMGEAGEPAQDPDHAPLHDVTLTRSFYVSIYEVTNEQFAAYAPSHDSGSREGKPLNGPHQPVAGVTWDEARVFAGWLTGRDPQREYLLPAEAEWERACRAGTTTRYAFGDTLSRTHAHFGASTCADLPDGEPEPPHHSLLVGSFPANAWGVYDMHGNVWEWCLDFLAPVGTELQVDPLALHWHEEQRGVRVVRGGSWDDGAITDFRAPEYVRSAERNGRSWWHRCLDVGIRLVSPLPGPGE